MEALNVQLSCSSVPGNLQTVVSAVEEHSSGIERLSSCISLGLKR